MYSFFYLVAPRGLVASGSLFYTAGYSWRDDGCTRFLTWRHPGALWPAVPIFYCWVQLSNSSGVVKVDGRARASVLLDAQTATER